jgi:GTP-binding protein HflX
VTEADLILHVVDVSHPAWRQRVDTVHRVLAELDASERPKLLVCNKWDLVKSETPPVDGIAVSARTGEGCDRLVAAIEDALGERDEEIVVHLPTADGRTRAWLYRNARIVNESEDDDGLRIVARVSPKTAGRLRRMLEPG